MQYNQTTAGAAVGPKDISTKAQLLDLMGTARTLRNHSSHLVEMWFGSTPQAPAMTDVVSNPETLPQIVEEIREALRGLSDHLEFLSARA